MYISTHFSKASAVGWTEKNSWCFLWKQRFLIHCCVNDKKRNLCLSDHRQRCEWFAWPLWFTITLTNFLTTMNPIRLCIMFLNSSSLSISLSHFNSWIVFRFDPWPFNKFNFHVYFALIISSICNKNKCNENTARDIYKFLLEVLSFFKVWHFSQES